MASAPVRRGRLNCERWVSATITELPINNMDNYLLLMLIYLPYPLFGAISGIIPLRTRIHKVALFFTTFTAIYLIQFYTLGIMDKSYERYWFTAYLSLPIHLILYSIAFIIYGKRIKTKDKNTQQVDQTER